MLETKGKELLRLEARQHSQPQFEALARWLGVESRTVSLAPLATLMLCFVNRDWDPSRIAARAVGTPAQTSLSAARISLGGSVMAGRYRAEPHNDQESFEQPFEKVAEPHRERPKPTKS